MSRPRALVAMLTAVAVMGAVAIWLTAGANERLSGAQAACHRQVTAASGLPSDAQFHDSEKRATGDAIVVRGEASRRTRTVVRYSCTVRGAPGGGFVVQVSTSLP